MDGFKGAKIVNESDGQEGIETHLALPRVRVWSYNYFEKPSPAQLGLLCSEDLHFYQKRLFQHTLISMHLFFFCWIPKKNPGIFYLPLIVLLLHSIPICLLQIVHVALDPMDPSRTQST